MRSGRGQQRQMPEGNARANTPGQELDAPCRLHRTSFAVGLCREQGGGPAPGHSIPDTSKSHSRCDKRKVDFNIFKARCVNTENTVGLDSSDLTSL